MMKWNQSYERQLMAIFNVVERADDMRRYHDFMVSEPKETSDEMAILQTLDKLGYPMNENGTYLYKEMIVKVVNDLNKNVDREELHSNISDNFSQFYVDVARNELDIGIKSFHSEIAKAVSKIDEKNVDIGLKDEIFNIGTIVTDYKENAFIIGNYIHKNKTVEKEPVKVYAYH